MCLGSHYTNASWFAELVRRGVPRSAADDRCKRAANKSGTEGRRGYPNSCHMPSLQPPATSLLVMLIWLTTRRTRTATEGLPVPPVRAYTNIAQYYIVRIIYYPAHTETRRQAWNARTRSNLSID